MYKSFFVSKSMPYQIQLKPFKQKKGCKHIIIEITDFKLHTNEMRPAKSIGKKIKESIDANQPGRIYFPISYEDKPKKSSSNNLSFIDMIKNDPDLIKMVREKEAMGYKILLKMPTHTIPVFPGKDTQEFIASVKGKRIVRRLAKEKRV